MTKNHKKFSKLWASQTDIGKEFGLSAVALGKILMKAGLRDANTKLATPTALAEGWCTETPLKTGVIHYMWSIDKIRNLLRDQGQKQLSHTERLANEVIATIKSAERDLAAGNDKVGYWALEAAFDDVPKDKRAEVSDWLTQKGYGEYAKN